MAEVVCVDGSVLTVVPVAKLDRSGQPYEVTLRLLLDQAPLGEIAECSGWQLSRLAQRLRDAQRDGGPDAFPPTGLDALLPTGLVADGSGPARARLQRVLPRDRELLCLRARDPDDGDGSGELRVQVREERTWVADGDGDSDGERGRWSVRDRAVLEAWGDAGRGVRCVLDGPALLALLGALLEESRALLGPAASGSPQEALQATRGAADSSV